MEFVLCFRYFRYHRNGFHQRNVNGKGKERLESRFSIDVITLLRIDSAESAVA
jgi:hypothetical protein